jgi:hypothetical protein
MRTQKMHQLPRICALLICALLFGVASVAAQENKAEDKTAQDKTAHAAPPAEETTPPDLDLQLYLLVGSQEAKEGGKMPASLDGIVKSLKTSLPFNHYRLGGTMLTRVGGARGRVGLKWNGEPLFGTTDKAAFYELNAQNINTQPNGNIRFESFSFGGRVPLAASAGNGQNVINYEPVGLNTSFTVRPDEPAVIGTLSAGQGGEIGVIVVLVRKTGPR